MILRRLALFVGLLFAFAATQIPEFVQQYRQRLGGAVDELSAVIARFDSDSAQQGLTEEAGIERLRGNGDTLARARGAELAEDARRLQTLREAQAQFRAGGPVVRLATFVTHFDPRLARGTFAEFTPAVPTTPEAFVCGLVGFAAGGGAAHLAGRAMRRRQPRAVRLA